MQEGRLAPSAFASSTGVSRPATRHTFNGELVSATSDGWSIRSLYSDNIITRHGDDPLHESELLDGVGRILEWREHEQEVIVRAGITVERDPSLTQLLAVNWHLVS